MQYMIRTEMPGFLQFVSLPDSGDSFKDPEVTQIRVDVYFISRLLEIVQQANTHVVRVEENFHEDAECRNSFECGHYFFSPGNIPVCAIVQRRMITIYAAGSVLFSMANPAALIKPIEKALLELRKGHETNHDLSDCIVVHASTPQNEIKWEELTKDRLESEDFDGSYWLATKWETVTVGEYRWRQGRYPHGFDLISDQRIYAEDVTHIAPMPWPSRPNKS